MGISHVLSMGFTDICDNVDTLIITNLEGTVDLTSVMGAGESATHSSTLEVGPKVVDILKCSQDQTLTGILGLDYLFNRTSDLNAALTSVNKAVADSTNSTLEITSGIDQLTIAQGEFTTPIIFDNTALDSQLASAMGQCNQIPDDATKDDCVARVNAMSATVVLMNNNITLLQTSKDSTAGNVTGLVAALKETKKAVGGVAASVGAISSELLAVLDYIMTGPAYTSCQFIGQAYSQIVQQAFCTGVVGSFTMIYQACAATVAIMVLGWYFVLVPWVVRSQDDDDALTMSGKFVDVYSAGSVPAQSVGSINHPSSSNPTATANALHMSKTNEASYERENVI
jgi:hypothetical protein